VTDTCRASVDQMRTLKGQLGPRRYGLFGYTSRDRHCMCELPFARQHTMPALDADSPLFEFREHDGTLCARNSETETWVVSKHFSERPAQCGNGSAKLKRSIIWHIAHGTLPEKESSLHGIFEGTQMSVYSHGIGSVRTRVVGVWTSMSPQL